MTRWKKRQKQNGDYLECKGHAFNSTTMQNNIHEFARVFYEDILPLHQNEEWQLVHIHISEGGFKATPRRLPPITPLKRGMVSINSPSLSKRFDTQLRPFKDGKERWRAFRIAAGQVCEFVRQEWPKVHQQFEPNRKLHIYITAASNPVNPYPLLEFDGATGTLEHNPACFPTPQPASGERPMGITWERTSEKGHFALGEAIGDSIEHCLAELARYYYREIFPLHDSTNWPLLMIELWPDSARVIVFPQRQGSLNRNERGCCQITIPTLQDQYAHAHAVYQADSPTPEEDDEFEKRYEVLMANLVESVIKTWPAIHAKAAPSTRLLACITDSGQLHPAPLRELKL
ncbi:MAG: hypothetical protein H8E27_07830 [Verrucomicrobia subdivision 3 bacterium]|nr:hypothetical protein [Limisphaerales bacterium]